MAEMMKKLLRGDAKAFKEQFPEKF